VDTTLESRIAAADAYQALFVPALFREWAARVADAAAIRPGERVLDVACGTGVLAIEAGSRTADARRVAGVDANDGMLAVAARLAPEIEWKQGTAESLPFADRSFEVVVSQFGLMFFENRVQALREMSRVSTSPGRIAVAVWDSLENIPAYADEVALVDRLAGRAAADALRAPFVLGDRGRLAALFTEAGIDSVEIVTRDGSATFPNVRTMVEADLRGWLPIMGVNLTEERIHEILREAESTLRSYVTRDGKATFAVRAHICCGRL
jgi:SAM-dependent methyltransferase